MQDPRGIKTVLKEDKVEGLMLTKAVKAKTVKYRHNDLNTGQPNTTKVPEINPHLIFSKNQYVSQQKKR